MNRSLLAAAAVAMGLLGCDGCKAKKERVNPLRYVEKGAEAVVEIRDIGALSDVPGYVEKHLGTVITKPQIDSLREELKLTFGVDPTSAEGLAAAGLAKKGSIVASLAADGSGALWIVPVDDEKKLTPLLDAQLKARAGGDQITTEKVGAVSVTTFATAFGSEKIPVAARGFAHGFVFIGFGKTAAERVKRAVVLLPSASILEHPEYRALVTALGPKYHGRILMPGGGKAMSRLTRLASRLSPQIPAIDMPLEEEVRGAGFSFQLAPTGIEMRGRVRMTDEGSKTMKAVLTPKSKVGPGVLSLDMPGAALHVQAAGDPAALSQMLAPDGTAARARLDAIFDKIKNDVSVDIEKEIFPLLSGHAAVSFGVGSLEGKKFREIVGNPRGLLWTSFALGSSDAKALADREKNLDEGLTARGMAITTRKFNNVEVRSIGPGAGAPALVETFVLPNAWVFANEPVIAERAIINGGGKDRLGGKGGLAAQLRLDAVVSQIAKFDMRSLPLLYRGIVAKGLDVVKLFSQADLRIEPVDDGLDVQGALVFAK